MTDLRRQVIDEFASVRTVRLALTREAPARFETEDDEGSEPRERRAFARICDTVVRRTDASGA